MNKCSINVWYVRIVFYPKYYPFTYSFYYLKAVALIILNKTENHKEMILICYLNLQHCKKNIKY